MPTESTASKDPSLGVSPLRSSSPIDGPTAVLASMFGTMRARQHIRIAMHDLRRIETHLRAIAIDDDFDQPNLATCALEELEIALRSLGAGDEGMAPRG